MALDQSGFFLIVKNSELDRFNEVAYSMRVDRSSGGKDFLSNMGASEIGSKG